MRRRGGGPKVHRGAEVHQSGEMYRGADRRNHRSVDPVAPELRWLLTGAARIALAAAVVLVLVLAPGSGPIVATNSLRVLASLAEVAAGVAMLGCWKIGGRAAPGWLGVALVDRGGLSTLYHNLDHLTRGPTPIVEPFGRLIVCIIAASAVLAAIRSPEVDSGFRPLATISLTAVLGLGILVALDRTFAHVYGVESSAILQHGTAAACAAVWLAVGLIAVGSRRGRMAFTNIWVAAYVLLLAGGAGLGATVAASTWPAVAQQFVLLVAGSLAATAAVSDLQSTVKGQDRYAFTLRLALTTTQADMERERERLDERLHDLRNAVAAMRTADLTLRRHASRIEPETRERLADALSAELSRLQTLIEPGRRTKIERFCLADAVTPVVMTERTWGSVIEVDFPPVTVIGDRDALSQVLQNLLTNARTYALGSPIALTTHKTGDRVQLRISDRGPGVPAAERDLVFDRGRRGSTSRGTHGSGIGLHVASRLMTEMGGRLTLDDTDCGATFVVEVPAAMVPTLRDAAPGWHLAEAVPDRGR